MRIRKSALAWRVSSPRGIRRTRSHSASSRKSMKRASPYWKPPSVATVILSSGEESSGRAAQPGQTGCEALGVVDAGLLAAEPGHGSHLLDDVDAVVVAQPAELGLVRLEHRHLRVHG